MLPNQHQDMMVAAQPYVVAMLVPAAMMMPAMTNMQPNAQVPPAAQNVQNGHPADGYVQNQWGQEMWPQMGYGTPGQENFQYQDYGKYNDMNARPWEHERSRRRRRTAQPKVPGMVLATGRQSEDVFLDEKESAQLREKLEAGGESASAVANYLLKDERVHPFSLHPLGCRLVQLAIQSCKPSVGKAIAQQLEGHVKEATESPHANYVLQKVIEQLSSATSSFIADELLPYAPRFSRHRFGCRIVCRLVEHCSSEESTQRLIEKLLEDPEEALDLCKHNFGHHVVQSILEHGDARHKEIIADVMRHDLLANARHRSSSYVLEAALLHCSPQDQESLVQFLVQPVVVAELAQSDFGGGVFVVRTLLKHPMVDAEALIQTVPAVAAVIEQ